jgi:uncharacterized NAD-dependent epimerase/dehydratase family protein
MSARFGERIALLAHEKFPERAKTAVGVLRYGDYDVAAVLDRERAGTRVADVLPAARRADAQDAPVVASVADVEDADALFVGVSPIGGGFDESWRPDVRAALERGWDVVSGLHYFLAEDEEFARLADERGAEIHDVRRPPGDLTVSRGVADEVDADVVLTVGTDCSAGKMTTTLELVRAARDRGIDAGFVPTGQTGIMIAGGGIAVDRVPADFVAGAVERMLLDRGDEREVLFVEGQGSVVHPAYSAVTCGIVHGAMPDGMVLCHRAGQTAIHGYESFDLPPVGTFVDRYEAFAGAVSETEVVAGSLNTSDLDGAAAPGGGTDDAATPGREDEDADARARAAVEEYAADIGAPATDPVRFDAGEILEAVLR